MASDLRYTLRSLLRAPWFTVAAVFTFALGIGVNVAVFTTVDRILLRPLPYHGVEELVVLRSCSENGECSGGFPSLVAFEGQARLTTIGEIAVAGMWDSYSVSANPGEAPPVRLSGVSVWAKKFLTTFLFGIEPRDPMAYSVVIAVLLTTAMIAAWLPARRAVRVDPATTLRAQ